ncbi:hypothetical protein BpHYR1_051610 [Brachionus plicatilis]|uniref:Uncharacterized protein n=1 Tax=Brachionus plicatilis TaxID=10195 RepID=A0A3M7QZC1_BRAPC|nr:hypothetical protein BpHYR1_051610 [Brachionus plicatilis]
MIGNKANAILENLLKTTTAFVILALHTKRKRGRPKKQKVALFYQNDCNLNSSDNESNLEQAAVEQVPPIESIVVEKAYVVEATVVDVDLPRKRGRPKKSTTQFTISLTKKLCELIACKTREQELFP